jgi:hypothetical protein
MILGRVKIAKIIAPAIVSFLSVGVVGCGDSGDDDATPVTCADAFAEGKRTPDLNRQPTCTDAKGRSTKIAQTRWKCDDGSQLFANKYGYGVEGNPWHTNDNVLSGDQGDFSAGTPLGDAIDLCQKSSP